MTSFWWDRGRYPRTDTPALEAVIFSLDAVLADPRLDGYMFGESVWALHCAGTRIGIVTAHHWLGVHRSVRALLGDGAVEVMVTGDEITLPKPHPQVYQRALAELGVGPQNAMAVEDSAAGLRAARAAGLATVVVTTGATRDEDFTGALAVLPGQRGSEPLSVHRCRRLRQRLTA